MSALRAAGVKRNGRLACSVLAGHCCAARQALYVVGFGGGFALSRFTRMRIFAATKAEYKAELATLTDALGEKDGRGVGRDGAKVR